MKGIKVGQIVGIAINHYKHMLHQLSKNVIPTVSKTKSVISFHGILMEHAISILIKILLRKIIQDHIYMKPQIDINQNVLMIAQQQSLEDHGTIT